MRNKLSLYFNTIRYIAPRQMIAMSLRPYLQKRTYRSDSLEERNFIDSIREIDICIREIDGSPDYLSRFDYDDIKNGVFTFLHESHEVSLKDWQVNASPLWVFNLHYFEYAVFLGYLYSGTGDDKYYLKFREILERWIDANVPMSISWHPYPISLRIINLLIAIQLFNNKIKHDIGFYNKLLCSIYKQYHTLILRKEVWLSGNHFFENLFTIVVASFFFEEDDVFRSYLSMLEREVNKQILPDGMHYELSPMYHKIILADLLRLKQISMHEKFPECLWLEDTLSKMQGAFRFVSRGFDRTTLFNDSGDNVARDDGAIEKVCKRLEIANKEPGQLQYAGYYRLDKAGISVLIDAGGIGPPEIPGHGHCDCLSFELSIDGKVLFANSGTYQYQGNKRNYFRSTRAHNTVMLDGNEQSQYWGEHRVAKRISRVNGRVDGNCFHGEYVNYLGQKHKREIVLTDKEFFVCDYVEDGICVTSYLHLTQSYSISDELIIYEDNKQIAKIQALGCDLEIVRTGELCQQSTEFGKLENGNCVVFNWIANYKEKHGYKIILKGE